MQFILKLFRALNSAQTPWQVTFAITLGMVAGLTPLSAPSTLDGHRPIPSRRHPTPRTYLELPATWVS